MHQAKNAPDSSEILKEALEEILKLKGHIFDVLAVSQPDNLDYAVFLSKIVSKLSSITGNMLEQKVAEILNENTKFAEFGAWERQDPDFPDTVFKSDYVKGNPGIEIKAWFPLATEMTARFKESLNLCDEDTYVAVIAWLPEFIIHGRPKIIDVWVGKASEVAEARDNHYYRPPHYLVVEPQNTSSRTKNLKQSTVSGYVFQKDTEEEINLYQKAVDEVNLWPSHIRESYLPSEEYVKKINSLKSRYPYRLDTNFAKIDRVNHPGIETFKNSIYQYPLFDKTIADWRNISRHPETTLEYFQLFKTDKHLPE